MERCSAFFAVIGTTQEPALASLVLYSRLYQIKRSILAVPELLTIWKGTPRPAAAVIFKR